MITRRGEGQLQPVLVSSAHPTVSMQKQARCAQAQLLLAESYLAFHLGSPHCLNFTLSYLPEKICILPNRGLDRSKVPIFLGIQGGSCCLACVETREGPSLRLEVRDPSSFWRTHNVSRAPDYNGILAPAHPLSCPPSLSLPPARGSSPFGIYRRNILD